MARMDLDHGACYRALVTRDTRFDGKFFTGVKTTGIYCRPICPARTPKRQSVTFFPTAAAAQEAGFRPCLRCRPETAPDTPAWRGTSSTVSRGLRLIELGALDDGDVEQLAERLGVGARHLRRLFRQHLGASPVSVAQTRRVLLAKQLLHESPLSVTDVAMASGFRSVRRFNETFRQLFGCPPSALRRVYRTGDHRGPSGEVTVLLRYRPPYDWTATLNYLQARAIPGIELVSDDRYSRTIEIDGTRGMISVAQAAGNALQAQIRFSKLSALPAIIARLRRLFDLAADPQAINAHLRRDRTLSPLVGVRPGLRVPGAWDGFELAVRAVLGQQITVAAATTLAGRLVAEVGEPVEEAPDIEGLTHIFPPARKIASAELEKLGIPGRRASALRSLAATMAADPLLLSAERGLEQAAARMCSLPGIGEWTAQYIAMREIHEPDAFPAADVGLLRAMKQLSGSPVTARSLLARAEPWRPWRAYAAHHLWASLHTPLRARSGDLRHPTRDEAQLKALAQEALTLDEVGKAELDPRSPA
jgi:AraC family transcriptional regulator of adaptative response / DNA-3-methyladenine glycosylase II